MLDEREAMIYNLALRVVRYYIMDIKKELKKDKFISITDLEGKLNFRKKHIAGLKENNIFFDKKGDKYYFKDELVKMHKIIFEKHEDNKNDDCKEKYKKLFLELKDIVFFKKEIA